MKESAKGRFFEKQPLKKKNLKRSKIGGGSGVGLTAVKGSMVFFLNLPLVRMLFVKPAEIHRVS